MICRAISAIRLHDIFIFLYGHRVIVPHNLSPCLGWGDGQHYKFNPDQSSVTAMREFKGRWEGGSRNCQSCTVYRSTMCDAADLVFWGKKGEKKDD